MKILFVCLGNICRSPLAEGILKSKAEELGLDWWIESAGTNGLHDGECPHRHSQKVALYNGINISKQRSRKITRADFEKYDVIYAFAEDVMGELRQIGGASFNEKNCRYFLSHAQADGSMDVPDPWYGGEDGFKTVYQIINEECDHIIESLRKKKYRQ